MSESMEHLLKVLALHEEAARKTRLKIDAAKEEAKKSIKPVVTYSISPYTSTLRSDTIYDPEVVRYEVKAKCHNLDALAEVGVNWQGGGMVYLFNRATNRLIMGHGGGYIYLKKSPEMWAEVSAFIVAHPEGGDITEIVEKYAHISAW